jgi:hypothetical protein
VLEETGYTVEPEALTGIYKHMTLGVIALVFRCRLVSGEPRINDEASEIVWLGPSAVASQMTEAFAVRVTDAITGPWPHIRHYDGTNLLVGSGHVPSTIGG